jgi:predicted nucleotidyltransferase component of viral defense system
MELDQTFSDQVRLLVTVLPQVHKEDCFALKGGTAINLFIRDMPRLSVDIDLAYLPLENRETSLHHIDIALKRIGENISRYVQGTKIKHILLPKTQYCIRIHVVGHAATIKIEVTPVLRGSINPSVLQRLSPSVEDMFGAAEMRLLHFTDIYGGKICAALDRQHPRDLFDIQCLLSNEGITEALKNCFLIYLISHNRPMAELLDPKKKDISEMYTNEFIGMTRDPISIEELQQARDSLISTIHKSLSERDKIFLLSVKKGKPDWEKFAHPEAAKLPAVQWKLHNISRMAEDKRTKSYKKLKKVLTG